MGISNERVYDAIPDIECWARDKLKQINIDFDIQSVDYIFNRDLYRVTFSKKGDLKSGVVELLEEWVVLEETRCEFVLRNAAREFLREQIK